MVDPLLTCVLADIEFQFSNLTASEFNDFFVPFFRSDSTLTDRCFVDVAGASPELNALHSRLAWNFLQDGARACLTGANPAGDVMWRMTGDAPFDRLRFEWHPTAFDAMYRNEAYGSYGIIVILALVMRLLHAEGLVLHGAAQVVDGQAILCTGPSGRGKSTISKLFDGAGVPVLTDERPIVRRRTVTGKTHFQIYGSPWPSSGGFALNASAPLKKIYFLEHGPENALLPLTTRAAVLRLLDVALVPWMDTSFFDPLIQIIESLIRDVPHAVLRFRPDASVVDFIRRDLAVF